MHFCSSSYTCTFVLFYLFFSCLLVCFIYALINIFSSYIWNISHNFILVFIFLVNHPLLRNVTNPIIKNKATSSQEMLSVWCLTHLTLTFPFFSEAKNLILHGSLASAAVWRCPWLSSPQDERESKMKRMEERMKEIELSLHNVKLLLKEKVAQLKDQVSSVSVHWLPLICF